MGHHCNGGYGDGETCIPGCAPREQMCARANPREFCGLENSHCVFCSIAPADLAEGLAFEETLGVWPHEPDMAHPNNEFVIDTRSLEANLPGAVVAFFFRIEPTKEADEAEVRRHRQAFLEAYGLPNDAAPLVRTDLSRQTGVFTLAS